MAGYTREIYKIDQKTGGREYAGYAKFDENDKFLGSKGGYGPKNQGINPDKTGNKASNNKSMLQNNIKSATLSSDAKTRKVWAPFR